MGDYFWAISKREGREYTICICIGRSNLGDIFIYPPAWDIYVISGWALGYELDCIFAKSKNCLWQLALLLKGK
jgi:hypothetical protein